MPPWEAPPARAPGAVLALLRGKPRASGHPAPLPEGPILEGRRHDTLTRPAGTLRRRDCAPETVRVALHAENQAPARPPLPTEEVDGIARDAAKWPAGPPWIEDPLGFVQDARLDHRARWLLSVLCRHADDDGRVWGGDYLAEKAGMSRHQVSRAVAELEAAGRVEVSRKPPLANRYVIAAEARSPGRTAS